MIFLYKNVLYIYFGYTSVRLVQFQKKTVKFTLIF